MDKELIDFVRNFVYTRNNTNKRGKRSKMDVEDIIQNIYLKLLEKNISVLNNNHKIIIEMLENELKKLRRINKKNPIDIDEIQYKEINIEPDTTYCNSTKITDVFEKFAIETKLNANHLETFRLIKLENNRYKEFDIDNPTARKDNSRILAKFKKYIKKKNIKLEEFYER